MSADVIDRDFGYDEMLRTLDKLGDVRQIGVTVGIRGKKGRELVRIAAANEFGTVYDDGSGETHIPERSFLRSTVDDHKRKYLDMLERAADLLLAGEDLKRPMSFVGLVVVRDVNLKILGRIAPANAPLTIKRKGSDVPLIDTGRLRASIDFETEVKR